MKAGHVFETQDGSHSVLSEEYGVSYHSKYGAIQESMHVFIESGFRYKAPVSNKLSILEAGFGTGLNAVLTLLEASRHRTSVYYETIEAFPLQASEARLLNYPALLGEEAAEHFMQLHELDWDQPHTITPYFTFRKRLSRLEEAQYEHTFDIVYYDAFAPGAQPYLWEEPVLEKMYNALGEGGVLVTYCAKGAVKRVLKNLGFTIEALKGPPGKREMTRAVKG
ncbi:MAG: tRNA (5-methylaminomethyl-2-thiouridine)(34)-methyltransferase MnmD [Phaeodactylibacter sp.]|nr:tRNA (5-methylaminomethyl-2-thiouridine)(34)-methyltransferase MnmD [Phaeodactylibacter sp.]MCB9276007.1 tRNA (5-methylaminomethyl-2-thiouridine)(34)-methyltransferase MnmD [Lewinellaceae bacterium]